MSDDAAQHFQVSDPTSVPVPQDIVLTITLKPDGTMIFNMPSNEILSYGLLAKAHAKLDELALVRNAQAAQAARGGLNGLMTRMRGG